MHRSLRSIFIFLVLIGMTAFPRHVLSQHEHEEELHGLNEVGAAAGLAYSIIEEVFAASAHLHYTRMLKGKLDHFGVGLGAEGVFDEHRHYTLSVAFTYRPVHPLWLSVGPGGTYFAEGDEWAFSLHLEAGYEFDVGVIHLGPLLEYAYAGDDQHFMIGLHLGLPF